MTAPGRTKPHPLPVPRPTDGTRTPRRPQVKNYVPQVKPKAVKAASAATFKLGKLAVKHDARTPYLTEFLDRPLLPKPEPFDYLAKAPADLGMLGNDTAGNCTCAGIAHMLQVQDIIAGNPVPPIEKLTQFAMDLYKAITLEVNGVAYDPADPSTDTGLALLDVLNYCRKKGIIGAFVKLRHNDVAEIEVGGRLFGGTYTGAQLPVAAQRQLDAGNAWTPTSGPDGEPGGWGGHCMYLGAGNTGLVKYVTWGKDQPADYSWVTKYADEMYVAISNAWVFGDKPAPSGFNIEKLRSFLSAL